MKVKLTLYFLLTNLMICFAQFSEADSLLSERVNPWRQQVQQGRITDTVFLESLQKTVQEFPSSPYAKGVAAYLEGGFWDINGKADQAIQYYLQAQKHLQNCCPSSLDFIENDIRIGFVSIHSGMMNFDTLHFQKGYAYVVQGYERARKHGYKDVALRMLDFMGDYHYYSAYKVEDFDKALSLYEDLYTQLKGSPDSTYRYIDSRLNLANVHRRLGNYELSESYFEEAMALSRKYGYDHIAYGAYVDKAEIFEEKKNYDKALELKLIAKEYADKLGNKEITNRLHRQLYRTYSGLEDYKNALENLELHFEGVREMNKAEALQLQARMEAQQVVDQKQLEIIALENKNLSTVRNFLIAIAILSALLLLILGLAYKRQLASNKTLKDKNQEILMAQMKGQNIERKRMAGELHDNLNTKIAAVRYRLEAQAMQGEGKEMLEGTLDLVNDIYEDIRLISHNLMPETVEELGLIPSLEKLFQSLNENDGTAFHLVSKYHSESLVRPITYELYNIIFEMVNNILKHAEARNAWISISQVENKILVTVKDDGAGFEVGQQHGGFGLKSINSRVEKLNGHYSVESTPGKGTMYIVEIPISK